MLLKIYFDMDGIHQNIVDIYNTTGISNKFLGKQNGFKLIMIFVFERTNPFKKNHTQREMVMLP